MENTANYIPRILVVDDEKTWFDLLMLFSEMDNIKMDMTYACNGQVAVDMIEAGEKFDAILMNIEMPFLDGLRAIKEVRRKDLVTPIIAWTCHDEDYMGENCKEVKMNDFIEKDAPQMVSDIVTSLRKLGIKV